MPEVTQKGAEIVKKEEVCDGSPVVKGTRTRVLDIAIAFEYKNMSPDEIVDNYPQLDLGDVHAALSYYYKNRNEIEEAIRKKEEIGA